MCGLTPGASVSEGGFGVSSDGRKCANGDSEGETDWQSQQPDLKFKGQQAGRGYKRTLLINWISDNDKISPVTPDQSPVCLDVVYLESTAWMKEWD